MFDHAYKTDENQPLEKFLNYIFYTAPVYFLLLYFLIIRNYFPNIKHYSNLNFILVISLLIFLVLLIYMFVRLEGKKKFIRFYLYFVFFLVVELIVQSTGGIHSVLYPLLYLLILVYMAISPLKNSLFFLALTILSESVIILNNKQLKDYAFQFNTHLFFFSVFFIVFYFTLLHEKKQKDKYRLLLKTYEGLKESKPEPEKVNKNLDISALSEQGRKKHDISVTHKLNDKIFEILQKLKEIMHPFTVMYLEIDEHDEKFFIKEVISDSDYINYNLETDLSSGYLGWVVKNKRTLNVNNLENVISDTFYYTSEEMIKSLLIVPAIDGEKIRGVLLADSREVQYFTSKEENLMYLIAYQIMQEIHNFKIMLKIEYNAKESAILNQVGKRLNVSLDLTDTIQVVLSTISELVKCDLVAVAFMAEGEKYGTIKAVYGGKYKHIAGKRFLIEGGICEFILKKKKKVLFRDFTSVSYRKNIFDGSVKVKDVGTLFLLPLISKDVPFGAVLIASRAHMPLESYTVNTIETLVNQSAISIANAKMYLKVEMMATTDGLTGLYNHKSFQEKITEEMERHKRYPESISMLLMDIDHFKRFNDTYGHPVGDMVLKKVADIFVGSLRKVDFAARYGGEEFVAILVNTDKKGAKNMGERIRKNIFEERIKIGKKEVSIAVSIGIATYPEDSKDKKGLINLADKALYYAKETGRNRCVHYRDIPKNELI